jgi:hypothetical protein
MTAPSTLAETEPGSVRLENPSRRRILFASVHSVLDFSNGASVATMDLLQGLTMLGFECQAFCAAKLDLHSEVSFEKMIGDLHEPYQVRPSVCGGVITPVPSIMRPFGASALRNLPEAPLREASSLASMLDTLATTGRSI